MTLAPPGSRLPVFPWDTLVPYADKAAAHPDGICDLSVGTPVDPTPQVVQDALRAAADNPGYPTTVGTAQLRRSVTGWLTRRLGAVELNPDRAVLPTVGSKELVAALPTQLGAGPGHVVLHPALAYPTYDVGARLAGARPVPYTDLADLDPADEGAATILWVNSPGNPTGGVLGVAELRAIVDWARARGIVVVSDECYAEFGWGSPEPVSVLDPRVCDGSTEGLLAVHSLSKRSNLAGYRAAFVAGDERLIATLLAVRKHSGLMVPGPVQAAMVAALDDDEHVLDQRRRYHARREALRPALEAAGFGIDLSLGGLYLWAGRGQDCWDSVAWLAERGVLVAPGSFYGEAGRGHVRVALTASDERIAAAAARITGS